LSFDKELKDQHFSIISKISEIKEKFDIIKYKELKEQLQITDDHFIGESKEKLELIKCSHCSNILNLPIIQCEKCEYFFCESCVNNWTQTSNECFNCKDEPFKKREIGRVSTMFLNEFKFKCPMECPENFCLLDIEKHRNSCEKLNDAYKCNQCHSPLEFDDEMKEKHQTECEEFKMVCIFCNESLNKLDYQNHNEICEGVSVYCEICNSTFLRKFEEAHKSNFCEKFRRICLTIKKLGEN